MGILQGNTHIKEGDFENYPSKETRQPQKENMLKHKQGCNKHFKDAFLYKGWHLEPCEDRYGAEDSVREQAKLLLDLKISEEHAIFDVDFSSGKSTIESMPPQYFQV